MPTSDVAAPTAPQVEETPTASSLADAREACFAGSDLEACRAFNRRLEGEGRTDEWPGELEQLRQAHPSAWEPLYLAGLEEFLGRDFEGAAATLERARELAQQQGSARGEAESLYVLAELDRRQRNLERAERRFSQAIDLARSDGNDAMIDLALYKLSLIRGARNRFLEQRDTLYELQGRFDPAENSFQTRNVDFGLASVHRQLGDLRAAAHHLHRVVEAATRADDAYWLAMAHLTLGVVHLDGGRPAPALEEFRDGTRSAEESRRARRRHLHVQGKILEGRALFRLGRVEESLSLLQDSLDASRAASELILASALTHLADAERRAGRLENSFRHYEEAVAVATEIERPDLIWEAHAGLAALHRASGRDSEAVASAREALRLVESLRSGVRDLEERTHFLQARSDAYELLAAALAATGPEGVIAGFAVADRAHGRTLVEMLARGETRAETPGEPQATPDVTAVQAGLTEDALLVEFLLGEEQSTMFAVDRDEITFHPLPPRGEIERAVEEYLEIVERPLTRLDARLEPEADFRRYADRGHTLFTTLFGGVRERLANRGRLIVVPDRRLHRLPFEVLLDRPPVEGEPLAFLGRRLAVQYLPTASFLHRSRAPGRGSVLVVGAGEADEERGLARLRHVEQEVRRVARAYPESCVATLVGDEADVATVGRSLESGVDVLHLAAHAILEPASGPQVLLGRDGGDGPTSLGAENLASLPRSPRLVVLSACETAEGELVGGEGVLGLVRAFTLAGSEQVVASLWKVDDEATAGLMGAFHEALQGGLPASSALHTARRQILAGSFVHPYFWSGFVLYGADGERAAPCGM